MSYWAQMTKTASIEEPGDGTLDDANVETPSWETAVDSRAAVQPVSGQNAQADMARTLGADYIMFVPRETNIGPQTESGEQWRVTVDGVRYFTVWVQDLAGKGRYKKVFLRRDA